jgi:predicted GTPase
MLKKLLRDRSTEFYLSGTLLWLLPGIVLTLLGLIFLWQSGWFWWFSGGLSLLALLSWGFQRILRSPVDYDDEPLQHLDPRPEWSDHDHDVWQQCSVRIEEADLADTPWDDIPGAMLDHLVYVAKAYRGDTRDAELAFTLPELLLMTETWAREYRAQVVEYMPFAYDLKISTVRTLGRHTDKALRVYNSMSPLVAALRIGINPLSGLAREFSSRLASRFVGDLSKEVQRNIRVILFEQVTQVGIDLYSGRLKFSDEEIAAYRNAKAEPEEVELRPLSVFCVGQVNAGKSSLINVLKEQCVAETDPLPATSDFHYHPLRLTDDIDVYLIDTPGLDGTESTSKILLREAVNADLLLWVSQANQPAKVLDKQFYELWCEYFDDNLARKKPPLILVTTNNDRLVTAEKWHPPYDLADTGDATVDSMLSALRYTREAMALSAETLAVPIALPPGRASYNVGVLKDLLISASDEARAAQLNRQRLDSSALRPGIKRALQQSAGLIKVGANRWLR